MNGLMDARDQGDHAHELSGKRGTTLLLCDFFVFKKDRRADD
jgi:hypothetical protein